MYGNDVVEASGHAEESVTQSRHIPSGLSTKISRLPYQSHVAWDACSVRGNVHLNVVAGARGPRTSGLGV